MHRLQCNHEGAGFSDSAGVEAIMGNRMLGFAVQVLIGGRPSVERAEWRSVVMAVELCQFDDLRYHGAHPSKAKCKRVYQRGRERAVWSLTGVMVHGRPPGAVLSGPQVDLTSRTTSLTVTCGQKGISCGRASDHCMTRVRKSQASACIPGQTLLITSTSIMIQSANHQRPISLSVHTRVQTCLLTTDLDP